MGAVTGEDWIRSGLMPVDDRGMVRAGVDGYQLGYGLARLSVLVQESDLT